MGGACQQSNTSLAISPFWQCVASTGADQRAKTVRASCCSVRIRLWPRLPRDCHRLLSILPTRGASVECLANWCSSLDPTSAGQVSCPGSTGLGVHAGQGSLPPRAANVAGPIWPHVVGRCGGLRLKNPTPRGGGGLPPKGGTQIFQKGIPPPGGRVGMPLSKGLVQCRLPVGCEKPRAVADDARSKQTSMKEDIWLSSNVPFHAAGCHVAKI